MPLPAPLPDSPTRWDGWRNYNSDNPYERLCLDYDSNPSDEQIEENCRQLLVWWQKKLPLKNQPSNPLTQMLRHGIDEVAGELSLSLGVAVEPIRPSVNAQESNDSAESGSALSPIYSAAFGLAVHGQTIMGRVPRLDLFSKQRAGVQQAETQRNFRGSIITSLFAIALGTTGYLLYHKQITSLEVETNNTTARTMAIKSKTGEALMERHKQEEQYKALRSEGIPVTEIIDYLANSFKPGNGLDTLSIAPDLSVTVMGQSVNEALMIDLYQTLQRCPVLTGMKIVRFGKMPPEQGVGVSFEIDGKAVSVGRIRLPEEKKK